MRDWLKALFVWQSVLSVVACGAVAYDAVPFAGHLELYVQVLGFWGIWLFTIPSLRSRKPGGIWGMSAPEKSALDLAFLLTPVANLALPSLHCKDPALIFWANLVVTGACYAWFFVGPGQNAADSDDKNSDASLPEPIKFALQVRTLWAECVRRVERCGLCTCARVFCQSIASVAAWFSRKHPPGFFLCFSVLMENQILPEMESGGLLA